MVCVWVFDLPGRREMLMVAPVAGIYGIDLQFQFCFIGKRLGLKHDFA